MLRVRIKKKSLNTLQESSDEYKYETAIEMPAMDFLRVTTNDEERERLLNRRKQYMKEKGDLSVFSQLRAESSGLYLVVNDVNKVIRHEGRNRSLAALQPKKKFMDSKSKNKFHRSIFFLPDNFENPDAKLKVVLKRNHRVVEFLTSQYGEPVTVSLEKTRPAEQKFSLEDPIGLGDQEIAFSTIIHKAGTPMANGRNYEVDRIISDAEKDAAFLLDRTYHHLYDYMRKEKGWGENEWHHSEVADATDELVNKIYSITDDEGPLLFKMKRDNWYRGGFDRKPVGDVVIKKK